MAWLLDLFRVLASCSSSLMGLSLGSIIYNIHKTRSTGLVPFTPFAAMLTNSHLWMTYGALSRNYFPLVVTFSLGDALALTYLAIYYRHTRDRAYANKVLVVCGVALLTTTAYGVLGGLGLTGQTQEALVSTFGYIGTVGVVLLYTSPFENIAAVFKYRSGVFIPIQMVAVGIVNSAIWVAYSALAQDWYVLGSNVFTLVIGLVQVAVYVVFHPHWHPLPIELELERVSSETITTTKDLEQGKVDDETEPATHTYGRLESPSAF